MQTLALELPIDLIQAYCQQHSVKRLSLFGSILRDDFRVSSDIDILIEFEEGAQMSLFDVGKIQVELSELLDREVDLKTVGFLSPYFRQHIINTAIPIYER